MFKVLENVGLTIFTGLLLRKVARDVQTEDPVGQKVLGMLSDKGTSEIRNLFSFDTFIGAADKAFDKLSA